MRLGYLGAISTRCAPGMPYPFGRTQTLMPLPLE
jgi:hypothetical protein